MTIPEIIHVQVIGQTASGKTALLAKIRKSLVSEGYCCASPDLDEEAGMAPNFEDHMPSRRTVMVLSEVNVPRAAKP